MQILKVTNGKIFDDVEQDIFEKAVMETYTDNFGVKVGEPFVTTVCKITEQELAGRRKRSYFNNSGGEEPIRRLGSNENDIQHNEQQQEEERQLQTNENLELVLRFTMTYASRYGIDVSDYPTFFRTYINDNLQAVTLDMQNKFLPVAEAGSVILFSGSDSSKPTMEPTVKPQPTLSPLEVSPTQLPSISPTITPPSPTKQPTDGSPTDQQSFIVGLAAGLSGATLIVILMIWYMRRRNARIREERQRQTAHDGGENNESIEVISADSPDGKGNNSVIVIGDRNTDSIFSKDTILSNPSMVSGGGSGSFSSDSDHNHEDNGLITLQEEFDMHKNQNTDPMTGDASLAMTRALMENEDNMDKNQWGSGRRARGGMDDPEYIEANALCETYDWLRKNEKSSLEER